MATNSNSYTISGINGEFLKDHDLIGKQDPYVIFECGSQKVETSVIKSAGLNASWTETYTLEVPVGQGAGSNSNSCQVMVYNKNLLADGLIGKGNFNLSSGPQRVVLMNKKGTEQGQLVFSLSGGPGGASGASATSSVGRSSAGVSSATTGMAAMTTTTTTTATTSKADCIPCQQAAQAGKGPICDTQTFTKIEDRPIVKEVKTYVREHHPVEKEFVVETRPTGQEREMVEGRSTSIVGTEEKIVQITKPNPCGGVPTTAAC